MKKCSCCKEEKDVVEFNKYKRSKDGYDYRCKLCQSESNKRWTAANWDKKISQQSNRRTDLQAQVRAYKEERGCACCKESDPICLELHHLVPSEKEIDPSSMAGQGWSWERMMTEIAKCVVVCSNCHKKIHAGRFSLINTVP